MALDSSEHHWLCLVLAKQQEPYQDLFPKNKNSMNYSNWRAILLSQKNLRIKIENYKQ